MSCQRKCSCFVKVFVFSVTLIHNISKVSKSKNIKFVGTVFTALPHNIQKSKITENCYCLL